MIALLASIAIFFSPRGGCTDAIVKAIDRAKTSVYVQAYSFTSDPIEKALERAHSRGLDVRVLLDGSWQTQAPKVEAELVAAGIPVAIDSVHAIAHSKVIILDDQRVITGSMNFTVQAERANSENVLIVSFPKVAGIYTENWKAHAAHSVAP